MIDKDALTGRPVLAAATAGTARHSLVIDFAMRPLFAYLHAHVVPTGVFAASEDFGSNAPLAPSHFEEQVRHAAAALTPGNPARRSHLLLDLRARAPRQESAGSH